MLFGEFLHGLRLNQRTDKYLPLPKSGRGYKPKDFVLPLVLMLNKENSSSDAFYSWLKQMGEGEGLKGLFAQAVKKEKTIHLI